MIENIKNAIYQNLNELFAEITIDEMTEDFTAYKEKLKAVAQIAEILGVSTEVIAVKFDIKTNRAAKEVIVSALDNSDSQ